MPLRKKHDQNPQDVAFAHVAKTFDRVVAENPSDITAVKIDGPCGPESGFGVGLVF